MSIVVPTEIRRLSGLRRLESCESRHFLKNTTGVPCGCLRLWNTAAAFLRGRSDVSAFLLTHGDMLPLLRCWVHLASAICCNPFAVGRLPFCVVQFYSPCAIKVLYSVLL